MFYILIKYMNFMLENVIGKSTAIDRAMAGKELTFDDGMELMNYDNIHMLGATAEITRKKLVGNDVTFTASYYMNYTNVCAASCQMCAFYRKGDEDDAYTLTPEQIEQRVSFLADYQDRAYSDRYLELVKLAQAADQKLTWDRGDFSRAVVKYAFKVMAYKDEYEVARLFNAAEFQRQMEDTFEGDYRLHFHLAPPLFAKKDPKTGLPRKSEFGPWMRHVFKVLSRLKGLRGTRFDCFGWTQERRTERELREQYFADIKRMCGSLSKDNYELAVELAEVPEQIRGFGHVKLNAIRDDTLGREGILGRLAKSKKQERAA